MTRVGLCLALFVLAAWTPAALVRADGPLDNVAEKVRPIPPRGIAVADADRQELQAGVDALGRDVEGLGQVLKGRPALLDLVPDVAIFHNAVRYALTLNEVHDAKEVAAARDLLRQGRERASQLRAGLAPWADATGLVVRGYRSRVDGSVQPYGLVVPASYQAGRPGRHRLDCWFHGRMEQLTELNFLTGRQTSAGEFTPADAFVLHPYGRYCNASKFAGETDLFEALNHVRQHYPIDEDRIAVRGFSMGGAACWHFAAHHAGRWAAAAPGAGFSETADFLRVFQDEPVDPPWYEKKLWHLYDCTDYALNLANCPTVAYSGEKDKQKQAADVMARAMQKEGLELVHLVGPGTGHSYHPQTKREIERRIDAVVARGREPVPARVHFTTWTLRYNRMLWVVLDGLDRHWERARVDAEVTGPERVRVSATNVSALTLNMPPGRCPLDPTVRPRVEIDGQEVTAAGVASDRSWVAHFRKAGDRWQAADAADDGTLRKRHGLQGPIDDAFMDSFLVVKPTGAARHPKVGAWADKERTRAIDQWLRHFRGEARVKDDTAVTPEDIAAHNLVLWGDPQSNAVLGKLADRLPVRWTADAVVVGDKSYPADHHVPVLICPNPLNPKKYVVLNSGFTFREYDYLNNARQVPKLPDYAVVDVDRPATSRAPGGIVTAGFFDEAWRLPPARPGE